MKSFLFGSSNHLTVFSSYNLLAVFAMCCVCVCLSPLSIASSQPHLESVTEWKKIGSKFAWQSQVLASLTPFEHLRVELMASRRREADARKAEEKAKRKLAQAMVNIVTYCMLVSYPGSPDVATDFINFIKPH